MPFIPVILLMALFFLPEASLSAEAPVKLTGQTMGTYYSVTVSELPNGLSKDALADALQQRLAEVNRQMSTWDSQSEISQFNQSESSDWISVSTEFLEVVEEARRVYELTEGAFDPTVAPVIDLWGFGDKRPKAFPTDEQIRAALEAIGLKHIETQSNPPALRKRKSGIQLNLSAIAKGYAVDDLSETLVELGIQSFLVDIGGETRAGAAKPDGKLWKLGIESPMGGLQQVVSLANESIATSGDYRNFFEIDGKKYSHAINPVTGRPVDDPPAAVSVRAQSCMTADAFATAFMVMDQMKAIQVAETEGISVLFQRVDSEGAVQTTGVGTLATGDSETGVESSPPVKQAADGYFRIWVPIVAAAVLFLLAVGAMSLGTMIQNRQIKGSCGGLASLPGHDGKSACEMCSIPRDECTNSEVRERIKAMADKSGQSNGEQG